MTSTAPIFLGGLMRSGTSLLRAMISQHHAIASGLETHWFDLDWSTGTARGREPLTPYLHRLGAFFEIEHKVVDGFIAEADSAVRFLDLFMAEVRTRAGKPRWAEKTPGNVRHMDRIHAHWPEARIVHIIRDPKDVFASFKRSQKYGGPADYGALWADFFADIERFKTDSGIADSLIEVRYEELVNTPETVMARILAFVDADWDPAVAVFDGKPDEHDKVMSLTGHSSTTLVELSKPLTQSRIGLWSDVLSEADIDSAREVVSARGLGDRFRAIEEETARFVASAPTGKELRARS